MKNHLNNGGRQRRDNVLTWFALAVVLSGTAPASAALVTIWEDQFTSISPEWQFPSHGGSTLVSQAVPVDVVGSEDGFEGKFTSTVGSISDIYITRTIPANLVQVGDRVEYAIRTQYPTNYAADRINLVAPVGGTDFDSGFVAHDSPGALTYLKEPGTLFDLFDTTLQSGLRAASNLYFGNNGWGGPGVESTFYVDYIRIVGERTGVPGDYNGNQVVDAADYVVWRNGGPLLNEGVTNGSVTPEDYDFWKSRFGATTGSGGQLSAAVVPEPAAACLAILGVLVMSGRCRRQSFEDSRAGG